MGGSGWDREEARLEGRFPGRGVGVGGWPRDAAFMNEALPLRNTSLSESDWWAVHQNGPQTMFLKCHHVKKYRFHVKILF